MLVSQDVKYPLPSIPMQQVFVTEVGGEKLGISSQRSPQEHAVLLRGDISGAQPLCSVCDDSRARFSQDDFRPILEAGSCRSASSVHKTTVTATTTHHHCHEQTKMTIDSSHQHSSDSTDPNCDSVDVQCGMPQSHTGFIGSALFHG